MANPGHIRSANGAARQIAKHGRTVTVQRTHPTTHVVTTFTPKVLYVDTVKNVSAEGSTVEIGDKRYLLEAGSYVPQAMDQVTDDGKSFILMEHKPIKPGEVLICSWIWLRAG